MTDEDSGSDTPKAQYMEQYFGALFFGMTPLLPMFLRPGLGAYVAAAVAIPVLCAVLAMVLSRGKRLSKSPHATDERYVRFLDLGGAVSIHALVALLIYGIWVLLWAVRQPGEQGRPWFAAFLLIAIATFLVSALVVASTCVKARVG